MAWPTLDLQCFQSNQIVRNLLAGIQEEYRMTGCIGNNATLVDKAG